MRTITSTYYTLLLGMLSLCICSASGQNSVTVNQTMLPDFIESLIFNVTDESPTEELTVMLTSAEGTFFSPEQLLAMFPPLPIPVHIHGNDTGRATQVESTVPTQIRIAHPGTFTFSTITFVHCWLRLDRYRQINTTSTHFMQGVTFENSGVDMDLAHSTSKALLFENVIFQEIDEVANISFPAAMRISNSHLNSTETTLYISMVNCRFASISAAVPLIIGDEQQDWDPSRAGSVTVYLSGVQFMSNRLNASLERDEFPFLAAAVGISFNFPSWRYTIRLSGVRAMDNGPVPGETYPDRSYNMALIDVAVGKSASDMGGLPQLEIDSHCLFQGNRVTPIRLSGLSSTTVQHSYIINNTVTLRGSVETDNTFSGGLAITMSNEQAVQIAGMTLTSNILDATAVQCEHAQQCSGGAILAYLTGNASKALDVTNSTFLGNQISRGNGTGIRNDFASIGDDNMLGGGIAVILSNTQVSNVTIADNQFTGNVAVLGGAVAVHLANASRNHINIACLTGSELCRFAGNIATGVPDDQALQNDDRQGKGGAVYAVVKSGCTLNNITVRQQTFETCGAADGGGVHVGFYGNERSSHVLIDNSTFHRNKAIVGAGVSFWGGEGLPRWSTFESSSWQLTVQDLVFTENTPYFGGALAAVDLELTMRGSMVFRKNKNSAQYIRHALVNFDCHATYVGNHAHMGAAVFSVSSTVRLYAGASSYFGENVARSIAGGFFSYNDVQSISGPQGRDSPHCFLINPDSVNSPDNWNVNFTFERNVAGLAGPAIYVNTIQPCNWLDASNPDFLLNLRWLDVASGGNSIVPSLYSGELQGLSVYQATPGASQQGLALPLTYFWGPELVQDLSSNITELLGRRDETQANASVATDPVVVKILSEEQGQQLAAVDRALRCSTMLEMFDDPYDPYVPNAVIDVVPGIKTKLNAIACDALNNSVIAALYVLTDEHSLCNGLHSDDNPHRCSGKDCVISAGLTIGNSNTRLHAYTQKTDDVVFYSRTANRTEHTTSFSAIIIGSSNLISCSFRVRMIPCLPGYRWPSADDPSEDAEDCSYRCSCLRNNHENEVDLNVQCNGKIITINAGYWANIQNTSVGDNSSGFSDPSFNIHACPPGYCYCSAFGHSDCTFDPAVNGSQCFDNRTGRLCGQCPHGSVATLTPYTGSCVRESECWDIGFFVGICFVIFVLSLLVIFLQMPISGDIRALIFFYAVLPRLFYHNDHIALLLSGAPLSDVSAGWEKFFRILSIMLNVPNVNFFGFCMFRNEGVIDSITSRFYVLIPVILAIVLAVVLKKCVKTKPMKAFNVYHGSILLLYIVYQWVLETSVLILTLTRIDGESYHFYDANVTMGENRHALGFAISGIIICFVLFTLSWSLLVFPSTYKDGRGIAEAIKIGIVKEITTRPQRSSSPTRNGYANIPRTNEEPDANPDKDEKPDQLRRKLAKGTLAWDLFRRALLVAVSAPQYGHSSWYRLVVIELCCILLLVVHLYVQPYVDVHQPKVDPGAKCGSPVFTSLLPPFRKGIYCNILEVSVLACMCLIPVFSSNTNNPNAIYSGLYRRCIITILMCLPLLCYFLLMLWKIFSLLVHLIRIVLYFRSAECFERFSRFLRKRCRCLGVPECAVPPLAPEDEMRERLPGNPSPTQSEEC
eukprot:scpid10706/ scgid0710/ 